MAVKILVAVEQEVERKLNPSGRKRCCGYAGQSDCIIKLKY